MRAMTAILFWAALALVVPLGLEQVGLATRPDPGFSLVGEFRTEVFWIALIVAALTGIGLFRTTTRPIDHGSPMRRE